MVSFRRCIVMLRGWGRSMHSSVNHGKFQGMYCNAERMGDIRRSIHSKAPFSKKGYECK
jgi:hypothetical protein